jgi:hypothetical protein
MTSETQAQKFKKKPVTVTASRWYKNGDHPHDNCKVDENGKYWEGEVVRYFRSPDPEFAGNKHCPHCEDTYHYHGFIDTLEGGHIVCPGDWIITGVEGERYPCKPSVFEKTYEPVHVTGFLTPARLDPFINPIGCKGSCGACGIDFSNQVTMYSCPRSECPMGMGPVICKTNDSSNPQ